MMRVRLKADGRLVEVTSEGQERVLPPPMPEQPAAAPTGASAPDAANARRIRSQTRLTQAEFAARIGVPIETVRNWEQGKRSPRGPARALLKLLDHAPDVAFSVLGSAKAAGLILRRTGLARSRRCGMVRVEENCHSVRRSQRRPHSDRRARHLGPARQDLRAHGRGGAQARLPPHRHRGDVRQRGGGRRGVSRLGPASATRSSSPPRSGRATSRRAISSAQPRTAWPSSSCRLSTCC